MSRDYPPHPLPAALAIVIHDGKALLVRRRIEAEPRKWGFPGGLIETGETAAQAALRELAEETGIVALAGPVIETFDVIRRDPDGKVRNHYLMLAVSCRLVSGTLCAGDDAVDAAWFAVDELADLPVHDDLPRLLHAAFAHIGEDGEITPAPGKTT